MRSFQLAILHARETRRTRHLTRMRARSVMTAALTTVVLTSTVACDEVATPRSALASPVTGSGTAQIVAGEDTTGDSGLIRLTYLCDRTFRVRNFDRDSATVTWDVKKTEEVGVLHLNGRGTAAYSDTTFTTEHVGVVRLYRNGRLLQSKGRVTRNCPSRARLTVIAEHGVIETHALQDASYATGTVVRYNFKAARGFEHVLVTLDDQNVPASGTVTMDADHVLIASADSVVKLNAKEQSLATAIRNVAIGPTPVAAYRTLMTTLGTLADRPDFDDMVRRAAYVAYDPIADSAALRRTDGVLANHVFALDLASASSPSASSAGTRVSRARASIFTQQFPPPDSIEPTTFLYVNGIFTSPEQSVATLLHLRTLLRQVARLQHPAFMLAHFYNRSMWRQAETPEQRRAACVASLELRMPFLGSRSWSRFLERCYGEHSATMPTDNDVTEAITQYVRLQLTLPPKTADAEVLADTLQQIRDRGRHVILIPHSQGNLMAEQAASVLRSTFRYDEARDSVGLAVVPLAAPTSNGWEFPSARLKPITVRGDIVPDLGLNSWPRFDTPQSGAGDSSVASLLARASANPYVIAYAALKKIVNGVALHSVDETYLRGNVGLAVRDSAVSSYQEVAAGELNIALTTDQLPVGQGRNLPLYTKIFNQHDLGKHATIPLFGRDIAWRSSDTSIITVSPQGHVTAVAVGDATIWGRTWAESSAVKFTVLPVPDLLSGTYSGYWETLDYSVPYIKDVASMTLQVSGTIVTGTVSWTSGGHTYTSPILSGTVDPMGTTVHMTLQPPDPEAVALGKRCTGAPDVSTPNGGSNVGGGGVDCYQVIGLHLSGSQLYGTSYAVGPIWNRIWTFEKR